MLSFSFCVSIWWKSFFSPPRIQENQGWFGQQQGRTNSHFRNSDNKTEDGGWTSGDMEPRNSAAEWNMMAGGEGMDYLTVSPVSSS